MSVDVPVPDVPLVSFLQRRIEEDEEIALRASPSPWRPGEDGDTIVAVDDIEVAFGFALSNRQLRATVDHIVRHDPTRVLREVEAKRAILAVLVHDALASI